MKRARKKNSGRENDAIKKNKFRYKSDMTELGYDPDTFSPDPEEAINLEDTREIQIVKPEEETVEPDVKETEETGDISPDTELLSDKEEILEEVTENIDLPEDESEEASGDDEAVPTEDEAFDEEDEENAPTSKPKKKKLLIFSVALATMVVLFFGALTLGGLFDGLFGGGIDDDYMVPVDKATGKINVLVLGVDKSGLLTDTIMVASYNLDEDEVNILSIPRDTRMYVGKKYQKINAAHAIAQSGKIKGPQGTIEAVSRLTGLPINYYVEFTFDAFQNTIDALGGVYFDVPQDMYYKDAGQKLFIDLDKGYQLLDGDKAEQLVRFRQYPQGDIDRVAVQQAFIGAIAQQKLNLGIIGQLPDLYDVLKEDIDTNFTVLDVTRYANNLKDLLPENIHMFQLPGEFSGEEYITSYWLPDMMGIRTLIETEFGYDASDATYHSFDHSSISKENADKRATSAPTKTASTPKVTEAPKKTSEAPKKTSAPERTDTPKTSSTPKATKKPSASTPEATVRPTAKPTQAPTASATTRPARPTPNNSSQVD